MSKPTAFPSQFPADAAAKISQAIISKSGFGPELIEPAYDLLGYALGMIFGSSAPFPKPSFRAAVEAKPAQSDEELAQTLLALSDVSDPHVVRGIDWSKIPWGQIAKLVITVILPLLGEDGKPVTPTAP